MLNNKPQFINYVRIGKTNGPAPPVEEIILLGLLITLMNILRCSWNTIDKQLQVFACRVGTVSGDKKFKHADA